MGEFWEETFQDKQEMWGLQPANSAIIVRDLFVEYGLKNILIPGIGYGRNAQLFREVGMKVTGIEISKTAIELARKHYGPEMKIYHGSVTDMPFDEAQYDGVFCYALIHLLDTKEREKLIHDCYSQLSVNGYMIFTAITKEATTFGQGNFVSKDRFEIHPGVKVFFYDIATVQHEFAGVGLFEISEIQESQPFYVIKCRKARTK